jgi:hypothetical protein
VLILKKKKKDTSQISNLMMHFKLLRKQEQTNTKLAERNNKIRVEINEIETKKKKLFKESVKHKVGYLKRLTRLTNPQPTGQKGGEKINKLIKMKNDNKVQGLIREYFENIHFRKSLKNG